MDNIELIVHSINILLWAMAGGFTVIFSLMLIIWSSINNVKKDLSAIIGKLDDKVTDIDRRVCRIEGALNNKEGCVIKASNELRKAE